MNQNLALFTSSPEYLTLLAKKKRIIWPLFILTVGMYVAYILAIAFAPHALATPVGGGVISIGIWLGLGLILFNFVVTLIYVYLANRQIEPLVAQLHAKVGGK